MSEKEEVDEGIKHLEKHNNEDTFRGYFDDGIVRCDDGYANNGCCGGCFGISGIKFCPFCGIKIFPKMEAKK